MTTTTELVFCDACDKVTYVSAVYYHYKSNSCRDWAAGFDCMHLESETLFCKCERN